MNGNVNSATGRSPIWRFGKTASFGVWFRALENSRIIVELYSGVIYQRVTTILWKDISTTPAEGKEKELNLEFKQRVEPKLIVTKPCSAAVSYSEFPITVFVCDTSEKGAKVLYSSDDGTSFKSFNDIKGEFYEQNSAGAGATFSLPSPDEDNYEEAETSAKGLLVPIVRIEASKSVVGEVEITEVLDILQHDTFAFENNKSDETGGDDKPKECEDTEPGAVDPAGDGEEGGNGVGGGMDPADRVGDGLENCGAIDDTGGA